LSQEQVPSLHIQHLPNRLRFTLQQKIARAAHYVSKYLSIFKFVKILNHSQVQVLSNKKTRSFLRLLWADIFLRQFIQF
jgi:hypothetical protein